MVTHNRARAIASILLVAMLAAPSFAQIGLERHPTETLLRRYVLVENADTLPFAVRSAVAKELLRIMRTSNGGSALKSGDIIFLSLTTPTDIASDGFMDFQLANDALLQTLNVSIYFPEGDAGDVEAIVQQRWDEAREKLQDALQLAQRRAARQKNEHVIARMDLLEKDRRNAQVSVDHIGTTLEAMNDPAPDEQLRKQLDDATAKLGELQLNRVGLEARREATIDRIDRLRKEADQASKSDPLLEELEKIQSLREKQLERVRELIANGAGPTSELEEAEAAMVRARVELLQAKRAASSEAASGALRELNNDMSRLIVQLAEIDARTKALHPMIAELKEATSARVTFEVGTLRKRLSSLQTRLVTTEDAIAALESDGQQVETRGIKLTPFNEALELNPEESTDGN